MDNFTPAQDERGDSGFTVFYMSINIGSMLGFAICGYLGERIGWHWGFGAAGVGMLLGVLQFIYFRSNLGDAGLYPNDMSEDKEKFIKNVDNAFNSIFLFNCNNRYFRIMEH